MSQQKNRGSKAWWNGQIVSVESIKISPFTHGLHYGTGAFEGIRAYKQTKGGGAIFRLREHIQRWQDSFKIMGFALPYDTETLIKAAVASCKANSFDECYLRPIAFIGDGPLGVYPGKNPPIEVGILNWEWGAYLGDHAKHGAKLKTSSYVRPHVNSIMTKGKITGQYVTGVMAKCEAIGDGYDEALLLDTQGYFAEGSGENLFIIRAGVVQTSPLHSLLSGITRQTVLEYFKHENVPVVQQAFTRDDLYTADECFMTGTAAEITPVREVDHRVIGKKEGVGPITAKLQRDFAAMVRGQLPPYGREWLTPIL